MKRTFLSQISATVLVLLSRFAQMLPANFSAVGSLGFFGGNAVLYLASLVTHDFFMGGFYKGFLFTYAGFAIYAVLGRLARRNTRRQLALLPVASFLFFLLSNMGVWWYWYPHTIDGLIRCFTLALPFYRNTVLGDLVFGYGWMMAYFLVKKIGTIQPILRNNLPVTTA